MEQLPMKKCFFLSLLFMTLSVLSLYSAYDRMINDYVAAGGIIGRGNQSTHRKLAAVSP
jgi:hypothetical protein